MDSVYGGSRFSGGETYSLNRTSDAKGTFTFIICASGGARMQKEVELNADGKDISCSERHRADSTVLTQFD